MAYMVFDLETTTKTSFRRKANPFDSENYVVARGWKIQGDTRCTWEYCKELNRDTLIIPSQVTILVGHNIKFDILYEMVNKNEDLTRFFNRGGKVWDTQYAEYLLGAQQESVQMNALNDVGPRYGGTKKIDVIKELWNEGVNTPDIDKDLLIDYLVGTEEEGRDAGDVGNTEKVFLGQIKKAQELGMVTAIQQRMEGLCATTEMEYRGLVMDVPALAVTAKSLTKELSDLQENLDQYVPIHPEALEFNWGSAQHKSALIFGGSLKYREKGQYKDDKGDWVCKQETRKQPVLDAEGNPVVFKSGKRKGEVKTKNVKVKGERKEKYIDKIFTFPGYTDPVAEWELETKDSLDKPFYTTCDDVIQELGTRDIAFLKDLSRHSTISKDLGTYFIKREKNGNLKGMMTCIMPRDHTIHHGLNHTKTITSRLSSSNPNLQNIPRGDKSDVKAGFVSRFGEEGLMGEVDYSQLEVVCQGVLSKDKQLLEDLNNRLDFHCKRVSLKHGIAYEVALDRCKNTDHPEHEFWRCERTLAKEFSFQRAYGAGAPAISKSTGIPLDDVKEMKLREEERYRGIGVFNKAVEKEVNESSVPFKDPTRGWKTYRRGQWVSPTGTRYGWRTWDAPDFLKEKGIRDTYSPPELKNYPVQGLGGEIVQTMLGKLWRMFVDSDNFGGEAYLVNTVHDCVWIDMHKSVVDTVMPLAIQCLQSVPEVFNELYDMDITVPFPVEGEVGPNMLDLHEYKVPTA